MKILIKLFWDYFAGEGVKRASDNLFSKRMSICRSNSCGEYSKPLGLSPLEKCNSCGCFLNVKARIDEFYIECPKKLW
jgi:hypothetical protein|tara:strand:- start:204 stop:437 length:234 start_codon:yes stop_codon:yes gene_type:complete